GTQQRAQTAPCGATGTTGKYARRGTVEERPDAVNLPASERLLHCGRVSCQFRQEKHFVEHEHLRTVDVGIALVQVRIGIERPGFLVDRTRRVVQLDVTD